MGGRDRGVFRAGPRVRARLAERGMSLVLTGRNPARLHEAPEQIRRAAPGAEVETVVTDLSTGSGVAALLDHVGERPVEVLVNNAGFGSYGAFAEADRSGRPTRWRSTSVPWSRWRACSCPACSPAAAADPQRRVHDRVPARAVPGGVRGEQGVRAVVQPGPVGGGPCGRRRGHRALSGSHPHRLRRRAGRRGRPHGDLPAARRARARHRGRAAGAGQGRAVVIPGLRNKLIAASGRFMPREWLTRLRPAAPPGNRPRPPIDVRNETDDCRIGRTRAGPADRRRALAVVAPGLPVGPGRVDGKAASAANVSSGGRRTRSPCAAPWWRAERPHRSPSPRTPGAYTPTARSRSARRPTAGAHRRQRRDPGRAARAARRLFLAPRLRAANQAMFEDLARAAARPQRRRDPAAK